MRDRRFMIFMYVSDSRITEKSLGSTSKKQMPLAVDHVFICVENPHAAERALADFGVQFGRRRIHQGQGTANACAFFDNAYLELLWRHDDDELQSEVVRPLGLW